MVPRFVLEGKSFSRINQPQLGKEVHAEIKEGGKARLSMDIPRLLLTQGTLVFE